MASPAPDLEFYVGSYTTCSGGGIHHVRLPGAVPERAESRLVAEARSPTWISLLPGSRMLLAIEEVGTADWPRLLTFRMGESEVVPLNAAALAGGHPCHIGVHPTQPLAATAHYSDGAAALWQIATDTGTASLLQRLQLMGYGPNSERQSGSHAHFAAFIEDGTALALTDLGGDAIYFFDLDMNASPKLVPRQRLALPPGCGPRHLVEGDGMLYLVCELDENVYTIEQIDGLYHVRARLAPFGASEVCDGALSAVKLSWDRRFLYVAGRNQSAIAWMAVASDGSLRLQGQIDCGGRHPRDLAIDPSGQWLIVANQKSGSLCLFQLNPVSGAPERIPGTISIAAPACILFPMQVHVSSQSTGS
jgi:6-phosphogluconolactonase